MTGELTPVGDVLRGVEIPPLLDGAVALEAVVLVKQIDADGDVGWSTRYSKDLTPVEVLGAIHAALLLEEDYLRAIYRRDDSEDDDD